VAQAHTAPGRLAKNSIMACASARVPVARPRWIDNGPPGVASASQGATSELVGQVSDEPRREPGCRARQALLIQGGPANGRLRAIEPGNYSVSTST